MVGEEADGRTMLNLLLTKRRRPTTMEFPLHSLFQSHIFASSPPHLSTSQSHIRGLVLVQQKRCRFVNYPPLQFSLSYNVIAFLSTKQEESLRPLRWDDVNGFIIVFLAIIVRDKLQNQLFKMLKKEFRTICEKIILQASWRGGKWW